MTDKRWRLVAIGLIAVTITIGVITYSRGVPTKPQAPVADAPPRPTVVPAPAQLQPTVAASPVSVPPASVQPEAESPAGDATIVGKVLLPTDAPPDLPVRVSLYQDERTDRSPLSNASLQTQVPSSDRKFRFERAPHGRLYAIASAPGYGGRTDFYLEAKERYTEFAIELHPTMSISGHVVDATHKPVDGAQVLVLSWSRGGDRGYFPRSAALASLVTTTGDGAFSVTVQPIWPEAGERWSLGVLADGFAPFLSDPLEPGTSDAEFALSPGVAVSGRVVHAATGEAVGDRTIALQSQLLTEQAATKTDSDGYFFFPNLRPGLQFATLDDPDLVLTVESSRFDAKADAGTPELVLYATPGARISGRVIEKESGAGISGASLFTRLSRERDLKRSVTGPDGSFEFKGLKTGVYWITCERPPGYGRDNSGEQSASESVTLEAGAQITEINFTFPRGLRISGTVVDEAGTPVPRAFVGANGDGSSDSTSSDERGRFMFAGLSAGKPIRVYGEKAGYAVIRAEPDDGKITLDGNDVTGVKLILGVESTVSGIVVDAQGRPKSGAVIEPNRLPPMKSQITSSVTSKNDGTFMLSRLGPGDYTLKVGSDWNQLADATHITLAKGQTVEGLRLVCADATGLTISGRVTDRRGQPVPARIELYGGDIRLSANTDANGQYSVGPLDQSMSYVVSAEGDLHSGAKPQRAKAGSTNVNFQLDDLATLEGRVVDATTNAPVTVYSISAGGGGNSIKDADGHFRITNANAGSSLLRVSADGYVTAFVPIPALISGETRTGLLVRLNPGLRVTGRVSDANGKPLAGAQVMLGDFRGRMDYAAPTLTQPDGTFALTGVSAGPNYVSAGKDGFVPTVQSITVVPGGRNTVDLVLSGGGTVEGNVTENGKPKADASISTLDALGRGAQTDAQGHYRIENVNPGTVRFQFQNGEKTRIVSATVGDASVTRVDVDFSRGTATLEGTVYSSPGQPATGNRTWLDGTLTDSAGTRANFRAQFDKQTGHYRFEGLPAGPYTIAAHGPNGGRRQIALELADGQHQIRDIEMFGGADLLIEITSGIPNGAVPHIELYHGAIEMPDLSLDAIQGIREFTLFDAASAYDGTAEFQNLGAGTYTLLVAAQDYTAIRPGVEYYSGAHWTARVIEVNDEPLTVRLDLDRVVGQ